MQGDQLLEEWKEAKETCHKIISMSIEANILGKTTVKQTVQEFMRVYEYILLHILALCIDCAPTGKWKKQGL